MIELNYFDKELFFKGKLAISLSTIEDVDMLKAQIFSLMQKSNLPDVIWENLYSNIYSNSHAYLRHEPVDGVYRTGFLLSTAENCGCTHFVYWSNIKNKTNSISLEDFLKDFW